MPISIVYGSESWNTLYGFIKNGLHVKLEHENLYVMEIKNPKKSKDTDNKSDCLIKDFIDAGLVFNINKDREEYEDILEQYKAKVNSKVSAKNLFILDFANPQRINFCGELFSIIFNGLNFKNDDTSGRYGRVYEEFLNFFLLSPYYDGEKVSATVIQDIFKMLIDNWYISESVIRIYPEGKTINLIKAESHWKHWYKKHNGIAD